MSSFKPEPHEDLGMSRDAAQDVALFIAEELCGYNPEDPDHINRLARIVENWIPSWRRDGLTMYRAAIDQAERDELWENRQLNIEEDILMEARGHIREFLITARVSTDEELQRQYADGSGLDMNGVNRELAR